MVHILKIDTKWCACYQRPFEANEYLSFYLPTLLRFEASSPIKGIKHKQIDIQSGSMLSSDTCVMCSDFNSTNQLFHQNIKCLIRWKWNGNPIASILNGFDFPRKCNIFQIDYKAHLAIESIICLLLIQCYAREM